MSAYFVTSNKARCPKCGSLNVTPIGKGGSSLAERMIFGKMMMGLIGAVVGYFAKDETYEFHCSNCGEIFSIKKV